MLVDHPDGTGEQADLSRCPLRLLKPLDDRRKVYRQHDVVLVKDAHPGRPAKGHALVPVAGQAQAVLVDYQTNAVTRQSADQRHRFVVRTIVADQEVERTVILVQNGLNRLGEMNRAVAGGNGDREQGGGARQGSNGLSSIRNLAGKLPQGFPGKEPRRMAVAPGGLDRVGANWLHALELEVGRQRFGPEDPLARPLVAAACARAFGAQEQVGKAVDLSVGPGHFQNLFGLQGSDVAWRIGHANVSDSGDPREKWLVMIRE